jgi:glycosyltransferase involved in cell wall biosynthesis
VEALLEAARLVARDPGARRGWGPELDRTLRDAIAERDAEAVKRLASAYDQAVPDPTASRSLEDLAAALGGPIPPFVAGYLGKLIPQKGVDQFLSALHVARAETVGLVVGFGSFRTWLEALSSSLAQSDVDAVRWIEAEAGVAVELSAEEVRRGGGVGATRFTGRLDHRYAPFAVAAMDVLAVPSILDEAFGMVTAEGAACGALPLVARHSGLAEVAGALESHVGRTGLFSYDPGPGAVHRIAAGLDALLELPPAERVELRQAVSSFVAREWTWERTASRLLEAAAVQPAAARRTSTSRPT